MKIYQSLQVRPSDDRRFASSIHLSPEAPALIGYMCGNSPHPGCLTTDPNVRLHSCEKGDMCAAAQSASVVRIQPIVAHLPGGADLAEVGVGGGGDDLEREAEIELMSREDLQPLLARSVVIPNPGPSRVPWGYKILLRLTRIKQHWCM